MRVSHLHRLVWLAWFTSLPAMLRLGWIALLFSACSIRLCAGAADALALQQRLIEVEEGPDLRARGTPVNFSGEAFVKTHRRVAMMHPRRRKAKRQAPLGDPRPGHQGVMGPCVRK